MPSYNVLKSDGTTLTTVADGTVVSAAASIKFIGRNIIDYGQDIAENQVHIMENFADTTSPSNPIAGQLWWDTNVDILKVYDGSSFIQTALQNIVEDTTPQLGGQLDVNTFGLGDGTNLLLDFVEDASAVNYVQIENEATGSGPIIRSVGADTNIDLHITAKGLGIVNLGSGGVKLNADLDANNNSITNLAAPSGSNDVATKDYVDNNHGLDNVVEDTFPQLGGNLFAGAFGVTTGNGELVVSFSTDGEGAINWVDISAALTGNGPTISAFGTDSNVDLVLDTKGTGDIDVSSNKIVNLDDPTSSQDAATKDYVDTEVAGVGAPIPAFRLDPGPAPVIGPGDGTVVFSSGGPGQAVTLAPVGLFPPGTIITLKNGIGTTGTTITPAGPETIDGVGGLDGVLLGPPLAFTRLIADGGTNWYVA